MLNLIFYFYILFQDLSPTCPKFIATQTPLPVSLTDFWLMVCEQGVEVLVALSSDIETGKVSRTHLGFSLQIENKINSESRDTLSAVVILGSFGLSNACIFFMNCKRPILNSNQKTNTKCWNV